MFLAKYFCRILPKGSKRRSCKNKKDDNTPTIAQYPPQIHLPSSRDSELIAPIPVVSESVAVYPQHAAILRPEKRPFKSLPIDVKIEEETNPGYKAETWYHVRIGEIIKGRYLICTKIGWGDTSTVWLANDLRNARYVSIKVCANPQDQRLRELDFMLHITRLYSNHPGAQNVATLLDHFRIHRNDHTYLCLVSDVLGPSLARQISKSLERLDIDWIKEQLFRLLQAVDFLHTVAYIVHGDIWPPNVLCAISDRQALRDLDELESQQPSDRKIDGDRVIYVSRAVKFHSSRMPVLIDFGNSRLSTAASEVDSMRELRESENIRLDQPHRTQRDLQWIGGLFIGMIEGRTLYKVVLSLPVHQPSTAVEVDAPDDEKQQLLKCLWTMKNSNGSPSESSSVAGGESRKELTAKELLQHPIFVDPEHRYHHTW